MPYEIEFETLFYATDRPEKMKTLVYDYTVVIGRDLYQFNYAIPDVKIAFVFENDLVRTIRESEIVEEWSIVFLPMSPQAIDADAMKNVVRVAYRRQKRVDWIEGWKNFVAIDQQWK